MQRQFEVMLSKSYQGDGHIESFHPLETASPIYNLPSELLATIFMFAVADLVPGTREVLTAVCSTWRNIAVIYPRLWSVIEVGSAEWTDLQLRRSKVVSLTLRCNSEISYERFLTAFQDNASRIRGCIVTVDSSITLIQTFIPLLGMALPELEMLELHTTFGSPYSFPFNPHPPFLRRLKITGAALAWASTHFSSLTELTVDNYPPNNFRTSFAVMLQYTPALELLKLSGFGPPTHQEKSLRIPLMHLSHLELHELLISRCAQFSNILSFPPSAYVSISGEEIEDVKDSINTLLSSAPLADQSTIFVNCTNCRIVKLSLQTNNSQPALVRHISFHSGFGPCTGFIGLTLGPYAQLDSLKIMLGPSTVINCLQWWTSLRRMPHISSFHLSVVSRTSSLFEFMHVLAVGAGALLPNLRILELDGVDCELSDSSVISAALLPALKLRSWRGARIEYLKLKNVGVPGGDILAIEELVDRLEYEA